MARGGENEATTFVTTEDLKVGGKEVPAGQYTIFHDSRSEQMDAGYQQENGEFPIQEKNMTWYERR